MMPVKAFHWAASGSVEGGGASAGAESALTMSAPSLFTPRRTLTPRRSTEVSLISPRNSAIGS